jgi:hypothetical protein
MVAIEVPTTDTSIDVKNLINCIEDQKKNGQKPFNIYCEQNVPLAFLAINEGGLLNAIGRIVTEEKGFIRSNLGTLQEMEEQKNIAKQIISGHSFYIDGTSAFVLAETGLLEKIYTFLPNIRIPQSVISLLLDATNKFRYIPGQKGYMFYSQGKINFSDTDPSRMNSVLKNIETSIKILESNPSNVEVISLANKTKTFSEETISPGLSDACILAQKNSTLVMTEDVLYLKMNELETKKRVPGYCSAFAILRVLYEQQKISFDTYLNFFSYLCSYRF